MSAEQLEMITQLKETLNRYESIVNAFKQQVETINTNKLLNQQPSVEPVVQEDEEQPKRIKNNSELRSKAIDMMLELMERDKMSKHKASKTVATELGLKARTVYSWLSSKKF